MPSFSPGTAAPHHTPAVLRVLEAEADALLDRLASPTTSGEVRTRLRARLRAGRCDIGAIAADLHQSVRTLQRRLDAEGTRFSVILDQTRRDVALELLDGGGAPERVAACVGLSGARALARAMKRWRARSGANLAQLPPVATVPHDRASGRRRSYRAVWHEPC